MLLRLEEVFRIGAERLCHANDEAACWVLALADLEGRLRPIDFNAAEVQGFEQSVDGAGVVLTSREDERPRPSVLADFDGLLAQADLRLDELDPFVGDRFEQGLGQRPFGIDDVAQRPAPAEPRARVVVARHHVRRRRHGRVGVAFAGVLPLFARGYVLRRLAERGPLLFNRHRQVGAGDLRQHADHVVEPGAAQKPTLPPGRVALVVADAGEAGFVQALVHGEADLADFGPDGGVDIRVDGIAERRHEYPHASVPLLVLVEVNLREPFLIEQAVHVAALDLGHHERVAIVVVPDVGVIEPRQTCPALFRPADTVVPVGDDDLPVRV